MESSHTYSIRMTIFLFHHRFRFWRLMIHSFYADDNREAAETQMLDHANSKRARFLLYHPSNEMKRNFLFHVIECKWQMTADSSRWLGYIQSAK